MQPDEIASELKKRGLRDWYSGVVEQRLVPGGAMIVVMHRLAPDDFTATLLEKGGWFHISLPLIAVEEITYTDRSGRDFWARRPGDLLSPRWTTPQAVDDIRRSLPKEIFEGQYQQNPQFGGSGICSIDRLARFQERSHYELIVHCWDLAATKNGGDWTVCAKFGLTQDQMRREVFDLLEIVRVRIELPESWSAWATAAGEAIGSQKALTAKLETKGFTRKDTNKAKGFIGLRVIPDEVPPPHWSDRE